jgi:acyl-CoA thioester hydrolase
VDGWTTETAVRVRFAETDAQGVAHHAAYLVWFEQARVEYLERVAGGYPALRAGGIEAVVTEADVRYAAPARFDDRLAVRTRCGDVRGARFRFDYLVVRDGERLADGWTSHACIDRRTLQPTRVPAWLRDAIVRAEAAGPSAAAASDERAAAS